jgi:bacillolysin
MTRRWTLLAGAIALSLSVPQAAFATAQQPAVAPPDPAAAALRDLKADADGAVKVARDATGDVAFVSSTDGQAMLDSDAVTPRGSAQEQLAAYGDAFGIDGTTSKAVVTQTLDSTTGGSVVRAEQVVDGVPVFGGQVVMSLDRDQGVVSVSSATTDATQVAVPAVSEATARQTALGITARNDHVPAASLSVTAIGRRLYDPSIVHTADPLGVRPVWQFEVTNRSDIRETVLVGTDRGEVALHFNDAPEIVNRRICDNAGARTISSDTAVPVCTSPARIEGGAVSSEADVNEAYENLGEAAQAYLDLDDLDLTSIIGGDVSGQTSLLATVRWCYTPADADHNGYDDNPCPYPNAFWDGTQMVFGAGYAGADDVVGHELTHGYVQHTSNLFAFAQSASINESLADTIGEIVDHRNGADDDTGWTLGEDLPGGAVRNMEDPLLSHQPDKMTSPDYVTDDFTDVKDGVHANDGVGNKTAYLISHGGVFNGQTVTGIDGSDPGLAKTGRLYLETIPRLTSGAQYADLGRALVSTCDELASEGTGGFTTVDCDSVRAAVAATELSSAPTDPQAAAAQVPVSCPSGTGESTLLARDDDGINGFGFSSTSPLWGRAPADGAPTNAVSGTESLFGLDPIPASGDPSSGAVTSAPFTVPATTAGAYLNFHHYYVLDYDDRGYYDGGDVVVSKLVNGSWVRVDGLPWINGPDKHIVGSTSAGFTGFGGDSHGYESSQVDLSSLAGQQVQVAFRLEGDPRFALYGWWIDDVRLYSCGSAIVAPPAPTPPSAPAAVSARAGTTSAVVSWQPPADNGSSAIASYRITRSSGKVNTAPASARSITLTGLKANTNVNVAVAAVGTNGRIGPARSVSLYGTTATLASVAKVKKGKAFRLTAKVVRRGTRSVVPGVRVTLQRHVGGQHVWHTVSAGTTNAQGVRAWSLRQAKLTYYRVVTTGVKTWLGSTSAVRTVRMR